MIQPTRTRLWLAHDGRQVAPPRPAPPRPFAFRLCNRQRGMRKVVHKRRNQDPSPSQPHNTQHRFFCTRTTYNTHPSSGRKSQNKKKKQTCYTTVLLATPTTDRNKKDISPLCTTRAKQKPLHALENTVSLLFVQLKRHKICIHNSAHNKIIGKHMSVSEHAGRATLM